MDDLGVPHFRKTPYNHTDSFICTKKKCSGYFCSFVCFVLVWGALKKSARGRMGSSKSLIIMPDFRHAQPHIAQEALFSTGFEPSFGMPPASVVAKTSGWCPNGDPKSMASSGHSTYLSHARHEQIAQACWVPCVCGSIRRDTLPIQSSSCQVEKPERWKTPVHTCKLSGKNWRYCCLQETIRIQDPFGSSVNLILHEMPGYSSRLATQWYVNASKQYLQHRCMISCCMCNLGLILKSLHRRETA